MWEMGDLTPMACDPNGMTPMALYSRVSRIDRGAPGKPDRRDLVFFSISTKIIK